MRTLFLFAGFDVNTIDFCGVKSGGFGTRLYDRMVGGFCL